MNRYLYLAYIVFTVAPFALVVLLAIRLNKLERRLASLQHHNPISEDK